MARQINRLERGTDGKWRTVTGNTGGIVGVDWPMEPSTDEEILRDLRRRGPDLSAHDLKKARTVWMGEDGPVTVLPGNRVIFYLKEGPRLITVGSQRGVL